MNDQLGELSLDYFQVPVFAITYAKETKRTWVNEMLRTFWFPGSLLMTPTPRMVFLVLQVRMKS